MRTKPPFLYATSDALHIFAVLLCIAGAGLHGASLSHYSVPRISRSPTSRLSISRSLTYQRPKLRDRVPATDDYLDRLPGEVKEWYEEDINVQA